ncbi:MAG: UvrD-helicase domain-containing protein, partial [Clostridia bacterium]|nr:UvrD-helicase domain-containing protein [Clostridia bacterium]
NPQQREAVFTVDGPLLILAGAGSGKTTVLVNKIEFAIKYGNAFFDNDKEISPVDLLLLEAYAQQPDEAFSQRVREIISSSPAEPSGVMAITFTNKAANELKERLIARIGDSAQDIWAGTFHSVCVRLLRRFIERLGYSNDFTIYDADDQKKVVKDIMKELNIDDKEFPVGSVINIISNAKDNMTFAEKFASSVKNDYRLNTIAKIYLAYEENLRKSNALDFDDLILLTVKLLETDDDVLCYCANKFKYVYVDEYQDTNKAQYRLVSLIASGYKNLTVVGDDDQSIYKFRGATIENILSFEKCFKNTKVIKLEQNYRSTSHILDAANAVIKNNSERKGKNLWTDRGDGEKIKLYVAENEYSEGRYIASEILKLIAENNRQYGDFAVLYRTNSQSAALEEAMLKSAIPYRVFAGMKFYERKEVKDIIAYLWLIANKDDSLRLKRIINEPKRAIGNATIDTAEEIARVENKSLYDVISHAQDYPQLSRTAGNLLSFSAMIDGLRKKSETMSLGTFVRTLLAETGYLSYSKELDEKDGRDRVDNIETLVSNIENYEEQNEGATVISFLQEVSLASELDELSENGQYVTLMTVHSAKGLEFPIVFCSGMEDGVFPSQRSFDEPGGTEEERRLAYVAITRAKEILYLTRATQRRSYYGPGYHVESRFLTEIPKELTQSLNVKPENTTATRVRNYNSFGGGFKKTQNTSTTSTVIKQSAPTTSKTVDLSEGDRVSHAVFGQGLVKTVRPMASDALIEVEFDKVGTKKLMFNYANLKKL